MLVKRTSLEWGTCFSELDNSERTQRDVSCTSSWWKKRHRLGEPWYSMISDTPHLWFLNFTVKLSISVNTSLSNTMALKKSGEWCFPRNIWGEGEHLDNYAGGESLRKHCSHTSDSDQQSTYGFPCTKKCGVWGWNILLYILVLWGFYLFLCLFAQ